jgi:hypothetical protein
MKRTARRRVVSLPTTHELFVLRLSYRSVLLAALLFLAASPANAQQIPVRDLPKPSKEIEDPFTMITGALELKTGQVLMVDVAEMDLILVDFAKGTRSILGRKGSGPGEYRTPTAMFRTAGDTLWVYDQAQARWTTWGPDLKPAGATIPMMPFDQTTSTALAAPMVGDRRGNFYASGLKMNIGRGGGAGGARGNIQMDFPDSVGLLRIDPRDATKRTEITRVKFPVSGKPEMKMLGERAMKYTMAYPGMVSADAWVVFPDGRIGVVRGNPYTVEFITPDGKSSAPVRIAFTPIPVTDADKKAEMDEAQRVAKEQISAAKKMMPAGFTMDFEMTPPASWPSVYPAITPLAAFAAPDGRLWVRRAIPIREGQEQWDVIDAAGKLVAKWKLPPKTTIVGVGTGVVYASRTDADDLRYAQRIEIPR